MKVLIASLGLALVVATSSGAGFDMAASDGAAPSGALAAGLPDAPQSLR